MYLDQEPGHVQCFESRFQSTNDFFCTTDVWSNRSPLLPGVSPWIFSLNCVSTKYKNSPLIYQVNDNMVLSIGISTTDEISARVPQRILKFVVFFSPTKCRIRKMFSTICFSSLKLTRYKRHLAPGFRVKGKPQTAVSG